MLLLDDSSLHALVVDKALPASTGKLYEALVQAWPRLAGRVAFVQSAVDSVDIHSTDVVVSSHACGALTDLVLDLAVAARARVAVLPCCHDLTAGDAGGLSGWVEMLLLRSTMNRRIGRTGLPAAYVSKLWGAAAAGAAVAWAVKLAVPRLHPIVTAVLVLGPYGMVFFATTWALGVGETSIALNRLLKRRK